MLPLFLKRILLRASPLTSIYHTRFSSSCYAGGLGKDEKLNQTGAYGLVGEKPVIIVTK